MLAQAGLADEAHQDDSVEPATERTIRSDPRLSAAQQQALITVYRSYVAQGDEET